MVREKSISLRGPMPPYFTGRTSRSATTTDTPSTWSLNLQPGQPEPHWLTVSYGLCSADAAKCSPRPLRTSRLWPTVPHTGERGRRCWGRTRLEQADGGQQLRSLWGGVDVCRQEFFLHLPSVREPMVGLEPDSGEVPSGEPVDATAPPSPSHVDGAREREAHQLAVGPVGDACCQSGGGWVRIIVIRHSLRSRSSARHTRSSP